MMDPGFLPGCVTLESSGFGLLGLCFFKQGCPAHSVSRGQLRLGWESTLYSENCMHISHGYLKNSGLTYLLTEYLLRTWFYSTKYGQSSNMEESGKKSCWLFCQVTYILSSVWKKNSAIHIAGSQHQKSRTPHMLTK